MAMARTAVAFALLACLEWAQHAGAHFVLTYPGWRGMTLIANETFPFGMQWSYPCGSLGITTNRTYWPTTGGAVALQPGWFRGGSSTLIYVNLGLGEVPNNHSLNMAKFHVDGPPGDNPYPGTACLPNVPLPAGVAPKSGDKATIQVVELHNHGAGSYNCVDIIFTDDASLVPPVNEANCFNSTSLVVDGAEIVADHAAPAFCARQSTEDGGGTSSSNRSTLFSSTTAGAPAPTSTHPSGAGGTDRGVAARAAAVVWGGVAYFAV
ncbi:hypothetical protein B0T26DRAFT_689419 [Lasiosphaeria miniovina]|uniref:Copper acquisition factor BIM1-like domain-containing protein n=1 Tax=Lasiosphaeria miniovina TaxID=1954250 RepID=A0AA40BI74_9PEZI|nr:uncharacterized protein B0T26DRAFT_689419 [Lasiosphaeria miniovina]KAK0734700.1 hypothetical protein B0T26DRAFT_689419 [Lasiosphaeria miniovina]